MRAPALLSIPYDWTIAPLLPAIPWLLVAACLLGVAVDLSRPAQAGERGRLASLCLVAGLMVAGRGWFAFGSWASGALVIAAYGVLIAHGGRFGFTPPAAAAGGHRLWLGAAVIAASLALKCVDLEQWPPNLNTYSAMTGEEGLKALAGTWPSPFFGIRAYPLAEGGQSPLHLPILVASMQAFGGTVFAVRFAEVVGSTILLAVFWAYVRTALPSAWALAALAVFAFSPWHLAQSRFGSFYSLCAALALAMLWLGECTRRERRAWAAWIGLGLCAAAISWAYAPLQVLYPFFAAVVTAGFLYAGKRWQALIAVGVFAAVVGLQLTQGGREALMRSDFGQLATDTVIWRKDARHATTAETQPLAVVADNFARNMQWWFDEAFKEPYILVWWAPALGVGLLYALSDLWRAHGWMRALYYLLGMLPPLLIFPLHRRTLIVWPLVYVAGMRFCHDLVEAAKNRGGGALSGRVAKVVIGAAIVLASFHGLRLFAAGNPAGLVSPYFGPADQHLMIAEARHLLQWHHVLFVNPGVMRHVITIGLYERARATGRTTAYELVNVQPEEGLANALRPGRTNCFVYLNDEQHAWVTPALRRELPGGRLIERGDARGAPLYSLYFFPGE
jgi:hypothetical protein